MKVRLKHNGDIFPSGYYHPGDFKWHVVTEHGEEKVFVQGSCENVDDDCWEDATDKSEVTDNNAARELVLAIAVPNRCPADGTFTSHVSRIILPSGHRIRKVQLRKPTDEIVAGVSHQSMQWAFVVERKVSG